MSIVRLTSVSSIFFISLFGPLSDHGFVGNWQNTLSVVFFFCSIIVNLSAMVKFNCNMKITVKNDVTYQGNYCKVNVEHKRSLADKFCATLT